MILALSRLRERVPKAGEGGAGDSHRMWCACGMVARCSGARVFPGTRSKMRDNAKTKFAKILRRNMTDAEQKLWRQLRASRFAGHKFKRQAPLGKFVVDFVAPGAKLIIEIDGGQHAEQTQEDAVRTAFLEQKGYRVLRFWNDDVLLRSEGVFDSIYNVLMTTNSPLSPGLSRKRERGV